MGGFLTHGLCQEGWERDFPPTGGFLTHGRISTHGGISHPRLCQEGWERDFPPTGATHGGISHPRGVSRRVGKGFPTHGGHPWGDFPSTGRGCLLWSVRPVVAALSVPAIASVSAAAGAAVAESPESAITVDNAGDGQLGFLAHGQKFNKLFP